MTADKKVGVLGKIKKFFKEVKMELKKVTWPNRQELTSYTAVVIVTVLIVAGVIWILDTGFTRVLALILP